MEPWQYYEWLVRGTVLLFVFAFGACVGSLTNVLVYRLPRGLDVITPTSRCPKCNTKLTFKENIPILGWLILRGKCRFCLSKISPEYPIVETIVAVLFAALYVLFYLVPQDASWLGIPWGQIAPEWARSDRHGWAATTWPIFTVVALLAGGLVAMTIIDLRTYTVPLQIPWFLTAAAVLLHTGYALFVQTLGRGQLRLTAPDTQWSLPTPSEWTTITAVFAATLGLGVSMLLLRAKLITQSFADYDDWARAQGLLPPLPTDDQVTHQGEQSHTEHKNADHPSDTPHRLTSAGGKDTEVEGEDDDQLEPLLTPDALITMGSGLEPIPHPSQGGPVRVVVIHLVAITIAAGLGAAASALMGFPDWLWLASALILGPLVAAATLNATQQKTKPSTSAASNTSTPSHESPPQGDQQGGETSTNTTSTTNTTTPAGETVGGVTKGTAASSQPPPHEWIMYPHARREMVRELAYLAAPVLLAILGAWLAPKLLSVGLLPETPPLWVAVLGGVLLGYLVGGAVVWAVRILGTLAFGKEALGLGDVHMMAAVGACLGWIDATLGFFAGAFVGIYLTIQGLFRSGQAARALPFVPALATGTLLVILLKPLIESLLNTIIPVTPGQPPINIP